MSPEQQLPTINGVPVRNVSFPESFSDVSQAVVDAVRDGHAIFPLGGRTWLDLGRPPTQTGVGIDLCKLNRIVDYPFEDMTITAEAGVTLAELDRVLAEKGQCLPIDAVQRDRATLGGLIATNTSGGRRLGYGTVRDYVLGLDVIDARGVRIHGGGRVVKNVAGYDMPRMHIGALGTLGIIIEATLKVRPLAESSAAVAVAVPANRTGDLVSACRASSLRPVAMELLNAACNSSLQSPADAGPNERVLYLLFEECREAVEAQKKTADQLLASFGTVRHFESKEYGSLRDHLCAIGEISGGLISNVGFKANLRPTDVPAFFEEAERLDNGAMLHGHAGSGIIWGSTSTKSLPALLDWCTVRDGNLIVTRCHDANGCPVPIWGKQRGDHFLMDKLRAALDPNRVINPGRFVVE